MTTNDITGDTMRTKPASDAYLDGYSGITKECPDCGKKTPIGTIHTCSPQFKRWYTIDEVIDNLESVAPGFKSAVGEDAAKLSAMSIEEKMRLVDSVFVEVRAQQNPDWPESAEERIDMIGQNGNTADHYEATNGN